MKKIFKNNWFLLFLMIPFFKPLCLQYYSGLQIAESVFVNWKIVSAAIGIALFVLYSVKYSRLSKLVVVTAFFELSIVFSTFYNHGYMSRAIIDAVSIVAYTAILRLVLCYNSKGFIRLLSRLMEILMLINFITMVIAPGGLPADLYYNTVNFLYFMVTDNGSVLFLIFCILVFMLESMMNERRISGRTKFLIFLCMLTALLSKSATTILMVFFFVGAMALVFRRNMLKIKHPGVLFTVYIVFTVYLLAMWENPVLEFILVELLNRSGDFTGRYVLWRAAIGMIKRHPLLGYGRQAQDYINTWGWHFSSHNYILEMMLQGGVLALIWFFALIWFVVKRLYRVQRDRMTSCLVLALFTVLTAALMEANIHSVYIFGVIVLCYHRPYMEMEAEK